MCGKKRILSILLLFMPVIVYAQHYDREADFKYERIGNNIRIIKYIGQNTNVRIPPQIIGLPVTEIGDGAFSACGLSSVTIPNTVITIGKHAFFANQLTSVTLGNRVKTIKLAAFADNRITSIVIPNSVKEIDDHAFNKNQLSVVDIPNSVVFIGFAAFANNRITGISLGDGASNTGGFVFDNNFITNIAFANGIGTINGSVFSGALRNVSRITIGKNVNLYSSMSGDVVWESFRNAYYSNGYLAGTYTLQNGRWLFQAN